MRHSMDYTAVYKTLFSVPGNLLKLQTNLGSIELKGHQNGK